MEFGVLQLESQLGVTPRRFPLLSGSQFVGEGRLD